MNANSNAVCLDTNVVIALLSSEAWPRAFDALDDKDLVCSLVVKIETLGLWRITEFEKKQLAAFFAHCAVAPISVEVADKTIALRQSKKIKTPDAIIAATALEYGCELWTRNTEDFAGVAGLKVFDPWAL